MTVTVQDAVERQLVIPVARQRVWEAITSPDRIAGWFCESVTLELQPGSPLIFHWAAQSSTRGQVEEVNPPTRFAFRWATFDDPGPTIPFEQIPSTLVEFTLDETARGTRLTVRESGFAGLPEAIRERVLRENSEGWIEETMHLHDFLVAEEAG